MRSEQIKRTTNEKHDCSDLSAALAAPEFSRGFMVFENLVHPVVRPRPRGQALAHTPAREDAGAPLRRHWVHLIFKDHQPTVDMILILGRVSDD